MIQFTPPLQIFADAVSFKYGFVYSERNRYALHLEVTTNTSFQDKELTLHESETTSGLNSALSTERGSLPRASQVLPPAPAPPRCFHAFKGC